MKIKKQIYQILNTKNRKRYIGVTKNFKTRIQTHKSNLRNNNHHNKELQKEWNSYGKNQFTFSIIEEIETSTVKANLKEKIIVKKCAENGIPLYNKQLNCQKHFDKIKTEVASFYINKETYEDFIDMCNKKHKIPDNIVNDMIKIYIKYN